MIENILTKFSEQITQNKNELVSEIMRFYHSIDSIEKKSLHTEVEKIIPFENYCKIPKEVFAVLLALGNNLRDLSKKNFSQEELNRIVVSFFSEVHETEFHKFLSSNKSINKIYPDTL